MIGNGASSPLRCAPTTPETAVSNITSPKAAPALAGRSHQGGAAGVDRVPWVGGRSARPRAKQPPTKINEKPAGGAKRLSAATLTRNAVQPQKTVAGGPTVDATRPYTTTKVVRPARPSRVPAAASAPNPRPCERVSTSRMGPATTGSPPSTPAAAIPHRRPAIETATTQSGERRILVARSISVRKALRSEAVVSIAVASHFQSGESGVRHLRLPCRFRPAQAAPGPDREDDREDDPEAEGERDHGDVAGDEAAGGLEQGGDRVDRGNRVDPAAE
jgi:hypothetical protein